MMLTLLIVIAAALVVVERLWPARELPQVGNWWARCIVVNVIQVRLISLAGYTWDRWLQAVSLFRLREHLGVAGQGFTAYFLSTFIYYWWHRWRHEAKWFW